MDDSTFNKVQTLLDSLRLLDRLRRKTEDTAGQTSLSLRKNSPDHGLPAADASDVPGGRIRDILREENQRLMGELMGLIREASGVGSEASAAKSTSSIAVQTDALASSGLVSHTGEVPTQAFPEAKLTFLSRVSTIEISPTEPKTEEGKYTLAARVSTMEILAAQPEAKQKQPVIVPRFGAVGITTTHQSSTSSSYSGSAPNQGDKRPLGEIATSAPHNFADATPTELLDRSEWSAGSGPGNRHSTSFVFDKDQRKARNIFKKAVICRRPGKKSVRVKLPDLPEWKHEAKWPWSSSDLSDTRSRLRDALNRFTFRTDEHPIPCLYDNMDPRCHQSVAAMYAYSNGTVIRGGLARFDTMLPPHDLCPSEGGSVGEHHGGGDALSDGMDESDSVTLLPEDQYSSDGELTDADYDTGDALSDRLAEYEPTRRLAADDTEPPDLSQRSEPSSPGL